LFGLLFGSKTGWYLNPEQSTLLGTMRPSILETEQFSFSEECMISQNNQEQAMKYIIHINVQILIFGCEIVILIPSAKHMGLDRGVHSSRQIIEI
jgi:hypothetical protein